MYVEHPYKFNDKFYAKVDGKFYEITREVAKAMLSAYRNEIYRSKKWQPEDPETMTRKTKWTELLDCVFSENTDGIGVQDFGKYPFAIPEVGDGIYNAPKNGSRSCPP